MLWSSENFWDMQWQDWQVKMKLIIGGAYQGKASWAAKEYQIKKIGEFPTEGVQGQCHLEAFSKNCVKEGKDVLEEMEKLRDLWKDQVLISREIGCGVVPVDPFERKWREAHGRLLKYLAQEADCVVRIFCGLPEVLK